MALAYKNLSDIVTLSRASARTRTSSAGVLTTLASGIFGIDYSPSTLSVRGMPVEEQRTNSIRNNTMVDAVAGSPGTRPTNWGSGWTGLNQGLQLSIAGVGVESGINYVDVNIAGTSTSTTAIGCTFEASTQTAAVSGQTWTGGFYARLIAGARGNLAIGLQITERDAGGSSVAASSVTALTPTTAALATQRANQTYTLVNGSTAFVTHQLRIAGDGASTYDVTIRIGMPQFELGAFASSVIATTGAAAATRLADSLTVGTLSPWFNATEGTIYIEATGVQNSGGAQLVSVDDGTTANRIIPNVTSAGTSVVYRAVAGSSDVVNVSAGSIAALATFKVAIAYKANDFAASLNGAAAVTDVSGAVPTGLTNVKLGANVSGSAHINGHLRKIIFYPSRKTNAELVTMST